MDAWPVEDHYLTMNTVKATKTSWEMELSKAGFDLVQRFSVDAYNNLVKPENRLPEYGKSHGVLIGNTKAIWPVFVEFLKRQPEWLNNPHPFDCFVEQRIMECLKTLDASFQIRFAHLPEPAHIAFQTLAQISGLAYLSKSHLSIHPEYGPWFSLRAALVIESENIVSTKELMQNPCDFCRSGCEVAFQKVMGKIGDLKNHAAIEWTEWLAVRDACPLGREYRFENDQLEYHYRKSKNLLLRRIYDL